MTMVPKAENLLSVFLWFGWFESGAAAIAPNHGLKTSKPFHRVLDFVEVLFCGLERHMVQTTLYTPNH